MVASEGWIRQVKSGVFNWRQFQLGDQGDRFVFGAAQRAQAQPVAVRVGLHHPFAATGAN